MRAALMLVPVLLLGACSAGAAPAEDTRAITIRHSSFGLSRLTVQRGDTVTFVLHNRDPIDHELIIGDEGVQARHEEGRQRLHHGAVAGEISVPSGTTRSTTYSFDEAGTVFFACHLPGHYDFGMHGEIDVVL